MATNTTFLESGTDATQDLSFFNNTSGTVASATDQHNTGPRSLKCSTGAGATSARTRTPTGVVTDSGSQVSFYFRFDTLPNANALIFLILDSVPNNRFQIALNTNGTLTQTPAGATAATGSTVLSVNTWYRISLSYYVTNTTTYQAKVYVNGVLDSTTNAGTLSGTSGTQVQFGILSQAGANRNAWYDDMYVVTGGASSSSQPDTGDIHVTAKRPNANGTTNGYTTQIGSGGSGYGTGHSPQVNEQPLNTANGWSMVGAGSAVTEEYNIESASTGDVDISAATLVDYMGWVYTKAVLAETAQIIINGVSSNISIPANTNTMLTTAAGSTTYPSGTGADIGEITSTTVTTVSLYECGIMFAYIPAVVAATIVPTSTLPLLGVG